MYLLDFKSTILNNKVFHYEVRNNIPNPDSDAVHIVQPCHNSFEMTKLSADCIKKFTDTPYILWIVANFCDSNTKRQLSKLSGINLIFNHTKIGTFFHPWYRTPYGGSLANGVALEIAAEVIDGKYMFVMHNDALPVKNGWLSFLKSKLNNRVKIAGVSQDKTRVNAVHQSGFLVESDLCRELRLSYMPDMPKYDDGDAITLGLRYYGFDSFVCKNTFNNPETVAWLDSPIYPDFLRDYTGFDRCFNDSGELIYLHLGRGTKKFRDMFLKDGRLTKKEWIKYIRGWYF
jgi:hypothetical protein